MQRRHSIALIEFIRKHFSHFFDLVNNEVTRGHQRPDYLAKCHIFFGNVSLSQNLLIVKRLRKKRSNALQLLFRENAARTVLTLACSAIEFKKDRKSGFGQKWLLQILFK